MNEPVPVLLFKLLDKLTKEEEVVKKVENMLYEEAEKWLGHELDSSDREVIRNYLKYCFGRYEYERGGSYENIFNR